MSYVHPPPDFHKLLTALSAADLRRIVARGVDDADYLHWDELRHIEPPDGLTHEEWWLRLKLARSGSQRSLPLADAEGRRFSFTLPDKVLALLHFIDQRCSGEVAMEQVVTAGDHARRRHLVDSLMEEAIRSSQLEGATTSRRVAKELLQSGRDPASRSERMIINNYRAMMFMRDIGDTLTPGVVLELHRIVTEGTLDDPEAAGRLQRPGEERVAVFDRDDGRVLHVPPPAEQLPARLERLCAFANDRTDGRAFIHPVIRAIALHFWLGYDHPFEDGNGRTARALFYWAMRNEAYRLVEYLSISRILRQAPAQYARAYLLSETDDGDLTYFLLYQLEVIERAVTELHRYLQRKVRQVREVETLLRKDAGFNHRQLALIGHALRNADAIYTFGVHARTHSVTHETARSDLRELEERGLLSRTRAGRQYRFAPVPDLPERLRAAGA